MIDFNREELLIGEEVSAMCVFPTDAEPASDCREIYRRMATLPEQTHSLNVEIAGIESKEFLDTDALITFERDIPIGVVTADCVPILMYASDVKGVAAIHAGWKGTLGGIVDNVLDELETRGALMSKLKVAFGVSISEAVYEVDETLADKFRDAGFEKYVTYPKGADARPHIDLQGVNCERLMRRGVRPENIKKNDNCTFSTTNPDGKPRYQSHRRSGGSPGRNLTMITLAK